MTLVQNMASSKVRAEGCKVQDYPNPLIGLSVKGMSNTTLGQNTASGKKLRIKDCRVQDDRLIDDRV